MEAQRAAVCSVGLLGCHAEGKRRADFWLWQLAALLCQSAVCFAQLLPLAMLLQAKHDICCSFLPRSLTFSTSLSQSKEAVGRCRDVAHGALSKVKPSLQTPQMHPTSVDHLHSLTSELEMDLNHIGTEFVFEPFRMNVLHLQKSITVLRYYIRHLQQEQMVFNMIGIQYHGNVRQVQHKCTKKCFRYSTIVFLEVFQRTISL